MIQFFSLFSAFICVREYGIQLTNLSIYKKNIGSCQQNEEICEDISPGLVPWSGTTTVKISSSNLSAIVHILLCHLYFVLQFPSTEPAHIFSLTVYFVVEKVNIQGNKRTNILQQSIVYFYTMYLLLCQTICMKIISKQATELAQ